MLAGTLAAQGRQSPGVERMMWRVRPVDPATSASMTFKEEGDVLLTFGADKPYPSRIGMNTETGLGAAKGPITGELTSRPGTVTFTGDSPAGEIEVTVSPKAGSSTPSYSARGRAVRIRRDVKGAITVETVAAPVTAPPALTRRAKPAR